VKPYETLFFTEPGIENEALDALIGKVENAITKNGGQVEKSTNGVAVLWLIQ